MIAPAFQFGSFKQNKEDFRNIIKGNIDKEIGTGFEGSFRKFIEIPKSVMLEYYKMSIENAQVNLSDLSNLNTSNVTFSEVGKIKLHKG